GVLTLRLDAALGTWSPEGDHGPRLVIAAFGARGRAVQIPGPLIRVPAGTEVRVTIRNRLEKPLLVRGLYDRAATAESIDVAPGTEREASFRAVTPGTYYYWGRTVGDLIGGRGIGRTDDSQLSGAIVVDAPDAPVRDRVLVMTAWVH